MNLACNTNELRLLTIKAHWWGQLMDSKTIEELITLKTPFGFELDKQLEVYATYYNEDGSYPEHGDGYLYVGQLVDVDLIGCDVYFKIAIPSKAIGTTFTTIDHIISDAPDDAVRSCKMNYRLKDDGDPKKGERLYSVDFMFDDRKFPFIGLHRYDNESVTTPEPGDDKEDN